jgi:hypothetical protein
MPWVQNPNTGESFWSDDPNPQTFAGGVKPPPAPNKPPGSPGTTGTAPSPKQTTGPAAFGATPNANTEAWWANQNNQNPAAPAAAPTQKAWWEQPKPPPPKPGKSGHSATQAPWGIDQSMPGVAEQNWDQNQDMWYNSPQLDWASEQLKGFQDPMYGESFNKDNMGAFSAPGQGQQHWDAVSGKFNEIGQYNNPNLAAESYQRTVQNLPGSIQPTFDAAFDRARDKSVGAANQQASARGAYGSSAALNGVNSVITDIEAQRANRHGDFALQDSANQRNWLDSAANQGRSADLSGLGIAGHNLKGVKDFSDMAFDAEEAGLNQNKFLSETAFGIQNAEAERIGAGIDGALAIDTNELNRTNSGFDASVGAQDSRDKRLQGMVDNVSGYTDDVTKYFTQQIESMFQGNDAALQSAIEAKLGMTFNNKNDAINALQSNRQAMNDFMSLYNPGGGGGGPQMPGGGG